MGNAKALELRLRLTYLVLSRFVYLSSKRITINRFYCHNSIQYETLITKTFYKIRYFVTKGKIRNINCLFRIDYFLIPCVQFDATTSALHFYNRFGFFGESAPALPLQSHRSKVTSRYSAKGNRQLKVFTIVNVKLLFRVVVNVECLTGRTILCKL